MAVWLDPGPQASLEPTIQPRAGRPFQGCEPYWVHHPLHRPLGVFLLLFILRLDISKGEKNKGEIKM